MLDIAIIGAGPAGMAAGIYAQRAGLSAAIFEQMFAGGQAATTSSVENYPGFEAIDGPDLAMRFEAHARAAGVTFHYDPVTELRLAGQEKAIVTAKQTFSAKAVILCMGASPKKLDVPGEDALRGAGVSYCATCDGALYRGKRLAVVGGGDTAASDALFLAQITGDITLIHRRDTLRAANTLSVKALASQAIRPKWNTVVTAVEGEGRVSALRLKDLQTGREESLPVDAVFVAVGTEPQTALVKDQIELNEQGYIRAGEDGRTSLPFVYAAGDIREKPLRQIVTAVSDGANAAYSAQNDLLL